MRQIIVATATLYATILPGLSQQVSTQGCGKADPSYIRTANETGGIPMFLQRSEAAKAFHLVRETTRNNVSTIFWGTGSLDAQPQTIDVPVDSVTQRITFAFSFAAEGGSVTIVSPSRANPPNSEITELQCGRIVTVVSPEAGTWHVELKGKGTFWADVQVQSDINYFNVEFVRLGGRPGHEGFFKIQGQPVAGQPATIRARISEAGARNADFSLVNERGVVIQRLQMRPVGRERDEFFGSAVLPNTPFRISLTGVDANGRPYQRFSSHLFHTETVEVLWNERFDELPAGSTKRAEFTVRNTGPSRTFKVTAVDAHRFVVKVEPAELTLAAGQSATVTVDLAVPAGTAAGTSDDVVVLATSSAGLPTSNSSVASFSVTAR